MSSSIPRRRFLRTSAVTLAGCAVAPYLSCGKVAVADPMKRVLGRTGFEVTTLGLGGQASLQWTPEGIDPVAIILKAHQLGLNYFDTSNVYGPSPVNYGKAFRVLNLVPGMSGEAFTSQASLWFVMQRARAPVFVTRRRVPQDRGPSTTSVAL